MPRRRLNRRHAERAFGWYNRHCNRHPVGVWVLYMGYGAGSCGVAHRALYWAQRERVKHMFMLEEYPAGKKLCQDLGMTFINMALNRRPVGVLI